MSRVLVPLAAVLLMTCAPAAAAEPPPIEGSWAVTATIVDASGGARPRIGAERHFEFAASACDLPCRVRLSERLPGGGHPRVAYERDGMLFTGAARTRMRCRGGSRVRARVSDSFRVTHAERPGGLRLAASVAGLALLEGRCRGRAAELRVRWTARRSDMPEPPTPSFASGPDPVSLTADGGLATFTDASEDDGTIVAREWDFGDPASGAANTATGFEVSHRYLTAGTFTVRLTVTDDDGLTSTVGDIVEVVP
jgi:hypothetical protein